MERQRGNARRDLDLKGEGFVLRIALAFGPRNILDDLGRDQTIIAVGRDLAREGTSTVCVPGVQRGAHTAR